jgi:hypothetical protein
MGIKRAMIELETRDEYERGKFEDEGHENSDGTLCTVGGLSSFRAGVYDSIHGFGSIREALSISLSVCLCESLCEARRFGWASKE